MWLLQQWCWWVKTTYTRTEQTYCLKSFWSGHHLTSISWICNSCLLLKNISGLISKMNNFRKGCKKCWYIYFRKVANSCVDISIVPFVPVVEFVSSIWIVDTGLRRRRVRRRKDRVARLVAVSFTSNVKMLEFYILTAELIQSLFIYKWQTGIGTWTRLGAQG